jgi:hypothetical protein
MLYQLIGLPNRGQWLVRHITVGITVLRQPRQKHRRGTGRCAARAVSIAQVLAVRKHSTASFVRSQSHYQKRGRWALVEIGQRFPRRGGRVLGVHGAGRVHGPWSNVLRTSAAAGANRADSEGRDRRQRARLASLPPPRVALRTPRGRPQSLPHARLHPHHLALPKEGVLKRTLRRPGLQPARRRQPPS